jgi:hypothetical protein
VSNLNPVSFREAMKRSHCGRVGSAYISENEGMATIKEGTWFWAYCKSTYFGKTYIWRFWSWDAIGEIKDGDFSSTLLKLIGTTSWQILNWRLSLTQIRQINCTSK